MTVRDDEFWEVRRVPHDDADAYAACGWTIDREALEDTHHGRYSVLVWRAIE